MTHPTTYGSYPSLIALTNAAVAGGYPGKRGVRSVPAMLAWVAEHGDPLRERVREALAAEAAERNPNVTPEERQHLIELRDKVAEHLYQSYAQIIEDTHWVVGEATLDAPGTRDDGPLYLTIRLLGLGEISVTFTIQERPRV